MAAISVPEPETVKQVTATYLHGHVSEFLHDLCDGRTVEVIDKRFERTIVRVRAVTEHA